MAVKVYNAAKTGFADGSIDWDTNTIKIMLLGTAYVPDADHANVAAITDEMTGEGYTRLTLVNCNVVNNLATDKAELRADEPTWNAITMGKQCGGVVIYKDNGADASSIPICYLDGAGFPALINGGSFKISWHADGIINFS